MLSRFSLAGGKSFKTCLFKFQPVSAITTSAAASENAGKTNNPPSNHPPEYPPPTSKRDFVNYPKLVLRETSPPVRLGFIPESWFQFFYPKTGYTGPYMLGAGVLTYMFSKEIVVLDHNLSHFLGYICFFAFIQIKFGDKIGELYNKMLAKEIDLLDGEQEREKEGIRREIQNLEQVEKVKSAVVEITKGTTEIVEMQMELAFRERLHEAYLKVKNKLDCQAELENVEKRIVQKNLMDYVLRNVMKSITPEMEKNSMQLCVKDLNDLAVKY